jgi:hypothetical protein
MAWNLLRSTGWSHTHNPPACWDHRSVPPSLTIFLNKQMHGNIFNLNTHSTSIIITLEIYVKNVHICD